MAEGSCSTTRVRLGDFEFDPATGELHGPHETTRLPPQPSHLLSLLVEKQGGLLTREEIRARLWPDVHVEFDQGLHFCIRQIRAAFGDSAATPSYVQTLPRRGYRLLVEPASPRGSLAADGTPASGSVSRSTTRLPRVLWLATPLAIAVVLVVLMTGGGDRAPVIAITPFTPPENGSVTSDTTRIATHLVAELSDDPRWGVVGPTTTGRYAARDGVLASLAAELDAAFIVNGRFVEQDGRTRLLAELIRTSDGVHVWVQWIDELEPPSSVAALIAEGVRSELGDADG